MIGFTFNNAHSGAMGVVFKSTDRTLLPSKRVTQYTIPGKSGTYDIEDGYENREITCELSFVGTNYHYEGVRTKARAVAGWLSGEGLLVFDDEPEKAYIAKVITGVSIEQIAVTGRCEVAFTCAPFAESLQYNQQVAYSVSLPHTEAINVAGSQEADCLRYITARGKITNLTVTWLKASYTEGSIMSALSNVHAASLLNTSLRSGTYYLALFLTDPTAAGTGTEASGGGYARKIVSFAAPSLVAGKQQITTAADVDYGTLSADIGTVAYWGIYDSLTGGNLLWYGAFTRSKNVLNGDAITVSAGAISCNLS
jgi:predicted phage tail component-like protein